MVNFNLSHKIKKDIKFSCRKCRERNLLTNIKINHLSLSFVIHNGKVHVSIKQEGKKVKSAHEPTGPHSQSLSRFPQHEVTRSIATPPGWDASSSQVTPPPPNILSGFPASLTVPIYTPGWREHNDLARAGTRTS